MNNYEVVDLFEVGSAGSTILDKGSIEFDEIMEVLRQDPEVLDE